MRRQGKTMLSGFVAKQMGTKVIFVAPEVQITSTILANGMRLTKCSKDVAHRAKVNARRWEQQREDKRIAHQRQQAAEWRRQEWERMMSQK